MNPQRAILIDDEEAGIETLRILIARYATGIRVIATTTDPEEGLQMIDDYRPEIVFMDISMPTMNAFELLDRLTFRQFQLVFTTAHQEYALRAIKQKAADYLLKPIDVEDFRQCVDRLLPAAELTPKSTELSGHLLELVVKDGIIFLRQKEIIRLEASGSYTLFFTEGGEKHLVSKSLKEYEAQLDPAMFFRCHHSHLINLSKVVRFINHQGLFARMSDGSQVDIARKNKETFLERLKGFS